MAVVTLSLQPDELLGLSAVAELDEAANGRRPDVAELARALMHGALAARLDGLGLPWAPAPDAVRRRAAETAKPPSRMLTVLRHDRFRRYAGAVLVTAALVVLWGGYVQGWAWTGFRANNQLWDWLQLLLLPIVVGTIPLWIKHAGGISPARRYTHLGVIAALAGLTAAGYLIPWRWTGFPGKTLWDWFGLLLLPAALVIAPELPAALRSFRPYHKVIIAVLTLGVGRHHRRRLRAELELDRLPGQHTLGLAGAAALAIGRPDCVGAASAEVGVRPDGRASARHLAQYASLSTAGYQPGAHDQRLTLSRHRTTVTDSVVTPLGLPIRRPDRLRARYP